MPPNYSITIISRALETELDQITDSANHDITQSAQTNGSGWWYDAGNGLNNQFGAKKRSCGETGAIALGPFHLLDTLLIPLPYHTSLILYPPPSIRGHYASRSSFRFSGHYRCSGIPGCPRCPAVDSLAWSPVLF